MPSLFADYRPADHGTPVPVTVAPLAGGDVERCAELAAAREGEDPARWRASFERYLSAADRRCWTARVDGEIAGYACVAVLRPEPTATGSVFPRGWYLSGVVVDPAQRRRGIGRALTTARLEWLGSRTARAWYFASSRNSPSLALHAALGFRLVSAGVRFPGVEVSGTSLLHVLDLAGRAGTRKGPAPLR